MGHQESPFSPFAEGPPSRKGKETAKKTGGQYSRDSVPVTGGKRVYGVPLEQLVIAGHSGVPRVVARLCHFIERHGMQTDGLFSTPGNQRSIAKIRADFDMYGDSNLERYKDVAAAAGCLKTFLRELPEPVVPCRFTADFVAALHEEGSLSRRCELLSTLVHSLPPSHYALLRFLCSFLRRVTNFHSAAHMSADTLGIVFAPNVFRLSTGDSGAPCLEQQAATNRLLAQLIHNYDRIFNDLGQRQRPGSSERSSGGREWGDESDASASGGGIQKSFSTGRPCEEGLCRAAGHLSPGDGSRGPPLPGGQRPADPG